MKKIFKQAWIYCFAIAIVIFLLLKNRTSNVDDMGITQFVIGFVTITPLVVGGLFSLVMSIINKIKNPKNGDQLT
jgi:hypothetical protein